jgi:hypothetical protein
MIMNQLTIIPASIATIPPEPIQGRHPIERRWVGNTDGSRFDRHSTALASRTAEGVEAVTNTVNSGQVFDFAVNMEKVVAFDPATEKRIRP